MKRRALVLGIVLLLGGCALPRLQTSPLSATLQGDTAHPSTTKGWVRTELYFGTGLADQPAQGVSESQWRAFLDREVTPRFPSGLSVFDIYGQWLDQGATAPERLRSKLLVILHEPSPQNDTAIEAIRLAWKKATGDLSVLRVTQPAQVSF